MYSHSTVSVDPMAVLLIFLFGGVAVIPHKYIFSIKKASDVLKIDPILFRLLMSSRMMINGVFYIL